MKKPHALVAALAATALLAVCGNSFAQSTAMTDKLLSGHWEAVYIATASEHATPGLDAPITRFLAAHAALATNRDNEALVLFLSLQGQAEQTACLAWTRTFETSNPDNAIALYLAGDAQARNGNLTVADAKFTASIQADPKLALAWLARGVERSLTGRDNDEGERDIVQATKLAPTLADAQASLGCLSIRDELADDAEMSFNKALDINPRFALALNGRGCARYGSGVGTEKASPDFELAKQLCPALLCASANQGFVMARIAKKIDEKVKVAEQHPGSTLIAQSLSLDELSTKVNQSPQSMLSQYGYAGSEALLNSQLNQLMDKMAQVQARDQQLPSTVRWLNQGAMIFNVAGVVSSFFNAAHGIDEAFKEIFNSALGQINIPTDPLSAAQYVFEHVRDNTVKTYAYNNDAGWLAAQIRYNWSQQQQLTQALVGQQHTSPSSTQTHGTIFPSSAPLSSITDLVSYYHNNPPSQPIGVIGNNQDLSRDFAISRALQQSGVPVVALPAQTAFQYSHLPGIGQLITAGPQLQITAPISSLLRPSPSQQPIIPTSWTTWTPPPHPGGVTNKNLEWTFVDRGHWPVITFFTLAYQTPTPAKGH